MSPGGQARKSLWIETTAHRPSDGYMAVRLVRACGSKPSVNLVFLIFSPVRLVRACGSKLAMLHLRFFFQGQARKSLWIETLWHIRCYILFIGQARKSLWIETSDRRSIINTALVRLVRACGSKQRNSQQEPGQALVRLVRACGSKPIQFYCRRKRNRSGS